MRENESHERNRPTFYSNSLEYSEKQSPASQSLSGLDNIDAFDCTIGVMNFVLSKNAEMKDEVDGAIKLFTIGKRYLKG